MTTADRPTVFDDPAALAPVAAIFRQAIARIPSPAATLPSGSQPAMAAVEGRATGVDGRATAKERAPRPVRRSRPANPSAPNAAAPGRNPGAGGQTSTTTKEAPC